MTDFNEKLTELKDRISKRAENIYQNEWAQKIIELDELLSQRPESRPLIDPEAITLEINSALTLPSIHTFSTEAGVKRRRSDEPEPVERIKEGENAASWILHNQVPSNSVVVDFMKRVKKELHTMCESVATVKMYIQLQVPAVSSGDNFGVSVQEDIIGELSRAEESGYGIFDSFTRYLISRGKLISKVLKYPGVVDYTLAIREMDEKELFSLWGVVLEIRNNYLILRDLLLKNLDKVKAPRKKFQASQMY
ncbi:hypothetical protein RCL1_006335 [Eukaryota sp. TZLM3-RCL]